MHRPSYSYCRYFDIHVASWGRLHIHIVGKRSILSTLLRHYSGKDNLRAVRHSGNIGRPTAKTGVNMATHFETSARQSAEAD